MEIFFLNYTSVCIFLQLSSTQRKKIITYAKTLPGYSLLGKRLITIDSKISSGLAAAGLNELKVTY